jgi:hypothetical protein
MELLHHEADILLNHVMDQDLDLVRDLGCIIGKLLAIAGLYFLLAI